MMREAVWGRCSLAVDSGHVITDWESGTGGRVRENTGGK